MIFRRDHRSQKGQCFVLMPYATKTLDDGQVIDWDEHYKQVLEPAISAAEMTPRRADFIFGVQPLIDRVWQGIQEAEVIVAEITGLSPNVMYEIGLAHVIGKRLLLLTTDMSALPVDLARYVAVEYSREGIGLLKLSRDLEANLRAARTAPLQEAMIIPLVGGEVEAVPAVVEFVAETYVTVHAANNRMGFLHPAYVSHTRVIKDMRKHFRLGQSLNGAFIVDVDGESQYSLIANQESPWPKILADYPEETTFIGIVEAYKENIGAFVSLAHGVNGLVPRSQLPAVSLKRGDQVEATVQRIDQAERQVSLRLERIVSQVEVDGDWAEYKAGTEYTGTITRLVQDRGFALIKLPPGRVGLLNVNRMSMEFREMFTSGQVKTGDKVNVEIVDANAARGRIILKTT
ncbi:S1 RNA-binding domain-containing protein [Kibdelosporangium aridum]|uniref:S1 RNA binding domain-containing protein n=1 Tax=Kibdelosporangium aridum TaxID=2030 RepID=A0A1Y5X354_KIBAR|nr:S1 RNA-binding domain-containing protein [Kibdelosporangium aridum]SMC65751.1 S1 RNA binding domain-containing protein [Kibdelosporangium aridum]